MLSKNYAKKHDHLGMEGEGALGGMFKDLQGRGGGGYSFLRFFFLDSKGI
jgi:hypothetical protein